MSPNTRKCCPFFNRCTEVVSKLHLQLFCLKNPDGCGMFEMYEEGKTPKEWLEQMLKVKA